MHITDKCGGTLVEGNIIIYGTCLQGECDCRYEVSGATCQIKPCRVYAEAMCRGDTDPDWEYILRGACFGYRVIDTDCMSSSFQSNYSSITKGETGKLMNDRVSEELAAGLVSIVDVPCISVNPMGLVPKGHLDASFNFMLLMFFSSLCSM